MCRDSRRSLSTTVAAPHSRSASSACLRSVMSSGTPSENHAAILRLRFRDCHSIHAPRPSGRDGEFHLKADKPRALRRPGFDKLGQIASGRIAGENAGSLTRPRHHPSPARCRADKRKRGARPPREHRGKRAFIHARRDDAAAPRFRARIGLGFFECLPARDCGRAQFRPRLCPPAAGVSKNRKPRACHRADPNKTRDGAPDQGPQSERRKCCRYRRTSVRGACKPNVPDSTASPAAWRRSFRQAATRRRSSGPVAHEPSMALTTCPASAGILPPEQTPQAPRERLAGQRSPPPCPWPASCSRFSTQGVAIAPSRCGRRISSARWRLRLASRTTPAITLPAALPTERSVLLEKARPFTESQLTLPSGCLDAVLTS